VIELFWWAPGIYPGQTTTIIQTAKIWTVLPSKFTLRKLLTFEFCVTGELRARSLLDISSQIYVHKLYKFTFFVDLLNKSSFSVKQIPNSSLTEPQNG